MRRIGVCLLCLLFLGMGAAAQNPIRLKTSDTEIILIAGPTAPRLATFAVPGQPAWENRSSESLIDSAQVSGQSRALHWTLNPALTKANDKDVVFVYESSSPHLRLSWEWHVRQAFGPIEHLIRIENLSSQEIWIPFQESLAFDWKIDPQAPLNQLFVEKGANTPSPIGTHELSIDDGYKWTGTSSTYGDTNEHDPREII